MKKILIIAALALASLSSFGLTFIQTVPPLTYTNLTLSPGSYTLTQLIVNAPTNNTAGILIDSSNPTNLTYINPAYTNTLSYGTNWNTTWTNFYGVVQTNPIPIIALIDITNNLVKATTNPFPQRMFVAVNSGNTAVTYSGVNYYFSSGIMYTNTSTNTAILTLTVH